MLLLCTVIGCEGAQSDIGEEDTDFDEKTDSAYVSFYRMEADFESHAFADELEGEDDAKKAEVVRKQLNFVVGQLLHMGGDMKWTDMDFDFKDAKRDDQGIITVKYRMWTTASLKKGQNIEDVKWSLPKDVGTSALESFESKYKAKCTQSGTRHQDFSLIFNPNKVGCVINPQDVFVTKPRFVPLADSTGGMFPEYNRIWEDGTFTATILFGQNNETDGANAIGTVQYKKFLSDIQQHMTGKKAEVSVSPVNLLAADRIPFEQSKPVQSHVKIEAKMADGKQVVLNVFLLQSAEKAFAITPELRGFRETYKQLSSDSDLIAYNGHSGWGKNVELLEMQEWWGKAKYRIVFLNGCLTYEYATDMWFTYTATHEDITGRKNLEVITNAQPSYFEDNAKTNMILVGALIDTENPRNYTSILGDFPERQIPVVSGEEDNEYAPSSSAESLNVFGTFWSERGKLKSGYSKYASPGTLAPGNYTFWTEGSQGDVDLYVRLGKRPTASVFHCKSVNGGSSFERCNLKIRTNSEVFVRVRGVGSESEFMVYGRVDE